MNFYSKTLFLDQFTPVSIYEKIKALYSKELSFLFESSISSNNDGNFSYIIIGARERIWYKNNECFFKNEIGTVEKVDSNPLLFLKKYYKNFEKNIYKEKSKELGIGLIDGFIGNVGYDIGKEFEPKLKASMNSLQDELKNEIENIEKELLKPYIYTPLKKAKLIDNGKFNFTKEEFFSIVEKSKEMIRAGDIFQILISNRFTQKAVVDSLSFYRALRSKNPSPYLFLLEFEDFSIAGSSPEVMIRLVDGHLLLRPIAGTRKRGSTLEKDLEMENELINDKKERAEHLMLVDLGRNDVGRVARAGSVKVTELMRIERYSHVMHIVSDVEAVLDEKYDMFDLFMATFTAGTMTGAPKIRAMELIANFEKIKRNFYSGSIAYFGFDGNMDSAITIRTSLLTKDKIIFQSGAGIVADSINEDEYLEVHNKLAANIATLKDLS